MIWLCLAALATACPLFAADAGRPIRESITLPTDSQVPKSLFTANEYLAEKRYDELVDLLVQLTETHGRELVAVPEDANRTVLRYVNVGQHCQRMMAALPPDGRAVARRRLDPQARRWFETWQITKDESQLERIIQSAYVSSVGDDALWALAECAWDRGDFSLADAFWSQLERSTDEMEPDGRRFPDPDYPVADVQARRILCAVFSRQFALAERKLNRFREQFPAARGRLAGEDGVLANILQHVLAQARNWRIPESADETASFGGSLERQKCWQKELDVGPLRWSAQWRVHDLPRPGPFRTSDRGPLKSFPVVDGARIFVSDGDAVRAWNLFSGEPAWPNDQTDPAVIYDDHPEDRRWRPDRPCVGVPWQTLTIHHGRLYARMGSPLAGACRIELHDLASSLVCLDIHEGQGKLVWKLMADELPGEGPLWSFEGTPVVVDATAYCVLFRRLPEPEFAILALEADSGNVAWLRPIGPARPLLEDAVNRVSHLLLTTGQGRLFLSTDHGAIVALSPRDGRILWAVSYESQAPEIMHGTPAHLQTGLLPPLFWNGLVFVAPNDSRLLFCLEADSGRVVWQRRAPERLRHLIGVTEQTRLPRLVASGNSLWAFDVDDGGLAWRLTQSEPAERGYGHGLLNGDFVFWPTREYLFQLDQASGELVRKIPLHTPDSPRSGGNLAVADGLVAIVETDRIAVYGEYGVLKERLRIELSQRPSDGRVWQRLLSLEAGAGQWDAAVDAGRKAWSFRQALDEAAVRELRSLFRHALQRQAARKIESDDLDEADRLYRETADLGLTREALGRLLWDWSRLDERRRHIEPAVIRLHELLALSRRHRFDINGQSAHHAARSELERLLRQYGREPFRPLEDQISRRIAAALSSGDLDAVRNLMADFPLLESTAEAFPKLIQRAVDQHAWPTVWLLYDEWHASAKRPSQRDDIERQRIAALRSAGYDRSADERMRTAPSANPQSPSRSWRYVARRWQLKLAATDRVVIPRGYPPGQAFACVLLAGDALRALDYATGKERWQQPHLGRPVWAAYGETNLLLATSEALSALRLETGETIWRKPWAVAVQSPTLHVDRDRLMAFNPQRGVAAFSPLNGDVLWEFQPPRGALQPLWHCDSQHIVLQTLNPSETWIVDAETGRLAGSSRGPEAPWRHPPLPLPSGHFGFVTSDRAVFAWDPRRNARWTYLGGMSQAHADPWLLHDGRRAALLVDGGTLVGLNPQSGQRDWAVGLADHPLAEPARQVAVVDDVAAAAWKSTLRAVSLRSGDIAWERELPGNVDVWSLASWSGLLAVTGTSRKDACSRHLLLLFRPDGRPVEMLTQPSRSTAADWHIDEQGIALAAADALSVWQPMDDDGEARATRKNHSAAR